MSADEFTREIKRLSTPPKSLKPEPAPPNLAPLRILDAEPGFRSAAICSFTNASGVLILANAHQAIARPGDRPVIFSAGAPITPDAAFLRAGRTRISIGLAVGATELRQIAAGGAEARLLLRGLPDRVVLGSWTCKPARP